MKGLCANTRSTRNECHNERCYRKNPVKHAYLTPSVYLVHSRAQGLSADIFHLDESFPRGYGDRMNRIVCSETVDIFRWYSLIHNVHNPMDNSDTCEEVYSIRYREYSNGARTDYAYGSTGDDDAGVRTCRKSNLSCKR